jgi:hypothetical protein
MCWPQSLVKYNLYIFNCQLFPDVVACPQLGVIPLDFAEAIGEIPFSLPFMGLFLLYAGEEKMEVWYGTSIFMVFNHHNVVNTATGSLLQLNLPTVKPFKSLLSGYWMFKCEGNKPVPTILI